MQCFLNNILLNSIHQNQVFYEKSVPSVDMSGKFYIQILESYFTYTHIKGSRKPCREDIYLQEALQRRMFCYSVFTKCIWPGGLVQGRLINILLFYSYAFQNYELQTTSYNLGLGSQQVEQHWIKSILSRTKQFKFNTLLHCV